MNKIKEALWKDYDEANKQIKDLDAKSDRYQVLLEEKDKVRNEMIELTKIEQEKSIKISQIQSEDKRERFRNMITIGTFIITTGVSIFAIAKTFKFDQEATITSTLGRNILNSVIPKIQRK